jgi:hypothetical protein
MIIRTKDDIAVLVDDIARELEEETKRQNPEMYDRKERLFQVLEHELGENGMSLRAVLRAIHSGVGQEHILRLQKLSKQNDYSRDYLYDFMPDKVARAVMNYQPAKTSA